MIRLLGVLALVCLLLNVWSVVQVTDMRHMKRQVQVNQQAITQGLRYSQINNQLIKSLANLAAQTDDKEVRDLLAAEGVTFSVNTPENIGGSSGG